MENKSKIYIAGHRGMVGSALARALRSQGYENIITQTHSELDLTIQSDVDNFFQNNKPEYVLLAAAKVGGILANDTYKAEFIYNNIMIAANVINSAYKHGVKNLLNLGSSCIYPKFAEQPLKENSLLSGSLEPTNEPYAVAKISALKLCRYYSEQYEVNYLSAMPTNLFGVNDNFNLETAHVLPSLMRKFHLARLLRSGNLQDIRKDVKNCPLGFDLEKKEDFRDDESIRKILKEVGITGNYVSIWGSGESYREFLYADDLADACIYLMLNYSVNDLGEFINIGTGKDIKIKDLAVLLREEIDFEGEIRYDHSRPDGTPKKLLDVSKIKDLGWAAKTDLRDGIRQTYDWYCETHRQLK